jgi:muramidase (phage lysozyme)
MSPNQQAFLDMIAKCEGTDGPDGYHALFGYTPANGKVFNNSYITHPRIKVAYRDQAGNPNYSTAAGRYQIVYPTFVRLQAKLKTEDFSPETQDLMALELIEEDGAMPHVQAGFLEDAMDACAGTWASLPSSTYPQPKRTYAFAEEAFTEAGGTVA